jgi:hypothetical protein
LVSPAMSMAGVVVILRACSLTLRQRQAGPWVWCFELRPCVTEVPVLLMR